MYPANISNVFRSSRIAASGLKSMRSWMNVISNNIANVNTVDTGIFDREGAYIPYSRQVPVFAKILSEKFRRNKVNSDVVNGVSVKDIAEFKGSVKKVFAPSHPAARPAGTEDAGYVYYPDISIAQEMADMKIAAASYEANVAVIGISNKMMQQAMLIAR